MGESLKHDLEAAYGKLMAALNGKDYSTLIDIIEPAKEGFTPPPKEMMNDQIWVSLASILEDITLGKFIDARQKGDWAGYYIQNYLDDPKFATIEMVKFHHVNGGWKISGNRMSSSIPREADTDQAIAKELADNSGFQL